MHTHRFAVLLLIAGTVVTTAAPATARPAPAQPLAVPAPEWDALFDRETGWTGADGIYSIPLSGDERPGTATGGLTFWTFSDTFVGRVNADGGRLPGSTLVNNTMAVQRGGAPDPARIKFVVNSDAAGRPVAQVEPAEPGRWFWPNDGIVVDGQLYLYSLRMKRGGDPVFNFETDGVSLLSTSASSPPPFETYTEVDTPLYLPASGDEGDLTFGLGVMPNTVRAGAPAPDGYLYVYGVRNDPNKKLLVSRVRPGQIEDFSAYRFWDGTDWSPSITAAVPVTSRVSSEFSVTPLADGRYILVFQRDTLSDKVAVRYGASPVGPWSAPEVIYTAPEAGLTPNTYTYNAKAHPHLSRPGELLISYNVNSFDFFEHFDNADIYRPRFIRLPLD
ncbi:hypothetical protein BH20ACT5_BH20ACT5_20560 [soil metagenome]